MTHRTRSFVLLGSFAALLAGSTSCSKSGGDAIMIGEFASLTGKEANFGTSSHEGTLMAIEELNAAGGVLGKKLELKTEDNLSKAGESANIVNKLISKDKVVAILGEVASSRSLEAAPICQQSGIPMISPASTNPKVTQTGDYIFRVCFTDRFQGTVMTHIAQKTLKATKVALFTDVKSDYSKGLAKYFKEDFTKTGQITAEMDYSGGDKDFKAQLTTIKNSNPEAVCLPGYYTDIALIKVQARQLGLNVPFFGGDGWEGADLLTIGKDSVEGDYFSTHCALDQAESSKSKAFVEAYKKKYNGKVPDAMAALGYDSAMILAEAIKNAGSTEGAKIRDALAGVKDYEAVTGKILMNKDRDAEKAAVILQVKNGAFKYLETVEP